jgi:pSer/pThr/pTyr-binding forkhead associated (FHA) protein
MSLSRKRCVLLVASGPDRGKEILVTGNRFRVGKNPDNDLVIADETVSRNHFEVVEEEGGYLVRDVGSTNGTIVDGARIREAYLRSGATITAGRVRIQVRLPIERVKGDGQQAPVALPFDTSLSFKEAKEKWSDDFERRYVAWLLKETHGNISSAARLAEMDRKYLHKLKKKHNV